MKKLLILPILMFGLTGCIKWEETPEYDNAWAMHSAGILTKVVQIDGHKYIILRFFLLTSIPSTYLFSVKNSCSRLLHGGCLKLISK